MKTLLLEIDWGGIGIAAIILISIASAVTSAANTRSITQKSYDSPRTLSLNEAGTFFRVKDIENDKILLQVGIDTLDGPPTNSLWYSIEKIPCPLRERGIWFKVMNDNGTLGLVRCKLIKYTLEPYGDVLVT